MSTGDGAFKIVRKEGDEFTTTTSLDKVKQFCWSESGRSVAASWDNFVSVYSKSGKRMLHMPCSPSSSSVSALHFGLSNYLAAASDDGSLKLWEVKPGGAARLVLGAHPLDAGLYVSNMALSRQGNNASLACCSSQSSCVVVMQLNNTMGKEPLVWKTDDEMGIGAVRFRGREHPFHLACVSESGALRIWDCQRQSAVASWLGDRSPHQGPATDVVFASTSADLAISVGLDGRVVVTDTRTRNASAPAAIDIGSALMTVDATPKGFVVGRDDGIVEFYDLRNTSSKLMASWQATKDEAVQSVRWSPQPQPADQKPVVVQPMAGNLLDKYRIAEDDAVHETAAIEMEEEPPQSVPAELIFSPMRAEDSSNNHRVPVSKSIIEKVEESPLLATAPSPHLSLTPMMLTMEDESKDLDVSSTPLRIQPNIIRIVPNSPMPSSSSSSPPPEKPVEPSASVPPPSLSTTTGGVISLSDDQMEKLLMTLRLQMHREIRGMHMDMLRTMYEQQEELKRLNSQMEELKAENWKLRLNGW